MSDDTPLLSAYWRETVRYAGVVIRNIYGCQVTLGTLEREALEAVGKTARDFADEPDTMGDAIARTWSARAWDEAEALVRPLILPTLARGGAGTRQMALLLALCQICALVDEVALRLVANGVSRWGEGRWVKIYDEVKLVPGASTGEASLEAMISFLDHQLERVGVTEAEIKRAWEEAEQKETDDDDEL